MKFGKMEDAVEFAVKNEYGFFVQRHFIPEEYMCEVEPTNGLDPEVLLDCDFDFFISRDDAEIFRRTNMWSMIVGNHQWTIDVQAYLDFYGQQVPIRPDIEQLIALKLELSKQVEEQKKLTKKMNFFPDIEDDDLPF